MKHFIALTVLLTIVTAAQPGLARDIERTEKTSKVLRFSAGGDDRLVVVDNVFGSIKITGYSGEEVRVDIIKTILARSERKLAEAQAEITLLIEEADDAIELYVDGPFRDKYRRNFNWRGFKREGYKVQYDLELKIPRSCSIELSTVDEGDIRIESIDGGFDVSNVNGGVVMEGVTGAGNARTVNGQLSIEYDRNPKGDCSFATINGDVRLYFRQDLSADFYFETMHGEAFTDFEVVALPVRTSTSRSKNGKKTYRVGHMSGVRAGQGGPAIELKTLNGDMFILNK